MHIAGNPTKKMLSACNFFNITSNAKKNVSKVMECELQLDSISLEQSAISAFKVCAKTTTFL
jgi:hypothetical protein